jgi:hypothetical protein
MRYNRLEEWEEIYGTFQNISFNQNVVEARIAGYLLRYPRRTPEGEFLVRRLRKQWIGRKVGILNTDLEFRIRWPDPKEESFETSPFLEWYYMTIGIPQGV